MVVFILLTEMKFDIDWYLYLKVWKINYVIPSTHAHFNIFHPGRRDGAFIWEHFSPLAWRDLGRSRLTGHRKTTMSRDLAQWASPGTGIMWTDAQITAARWFTKEESAEIFVVISHILYLATETNVLLASITRKCNVFRPTVYRIKKRFENGAKRQKVNKGDRPRKISQRQRRVLVGNLHVSAADAGIFLLGLWSSRGSAASYLRGVGECSPEKCWVLEA